jgi:MFS family permease
MDRNIRLLYIHNFLTDFRFQEAFIVIYFAQITGSYTIAMSILAVATITKAVTDIPTGIFSDKIGRKLTLTAGSVCFTLSIILYAFAPSTVWLFLGALFSGFGLSLFSGNNNALLYETLKNNGQENQYHHYQGRASSMFQLALGLSAFAATFFTHNGLRYLFVLGIIPQFLASIVSLFFEEPIIHTALEQKSFAHLKQAFLLVFHNPRLRWMTVGQSISWGFGEAGFSFGSAFINTLWPTWAVGLYRSSTHALGFIGFWFSGPLLDRIKGAYTIVLASVYGLVSNLVAVFMDNVISPILFLSASIFFGPYMIACEQILQKEFSDEQRATMSSVVSFSGSLVYAFAALSIGLISDKFGLIPAVVYETIAAAMALPVYVWLFRKYF